jgi:hypothetical protein
MASIGEHKYFQLYNELIYFSNRAAIKLQTIFTLLYQMA